MKHFFGFLGFDTKKDEMRVRCLTKTVVDRSPNGDVCSSFVS